MEIYVGTSGWCYDWNLEGTFDWYLKNSKLNAVELNVSFYRFPFPNQIKTWANKGKSLRWIIKVSRIITHRFRLSEKSYSFYERFINLFKTLDNYIDFYLFQLPPNFTPKSIDKIEKFIEYTNLKERFALEVRNEKWFKEEYYKWSENKKITWVSIDAPDFGEVIIKTNDYIYIRFHGKDVWYAYDYSKKELENIAKKIVEKKPKKVYAFFNNNHAMLKNAQLFMKILKNYETN
ncbi:MAG: DUF72 domain-containing protein [candidate division WOR-3 bacterium]